LWHLEHSSCFSCKLCVTGGRSFLLTGPDAAAVHQENIAKLSKMSAEEILQEQQKLASQLDPKLLKFIQSRRHGKQLSGMMDETSKQSSDISELTYETSSSLKMGTVLPSGLVLTKDVDTSSSQHNVDTMTTSQSEDRILISSASVVTSENDKHSQSIHVENDGTSGKSDIEMNSIVDDVALKSSEAYKWLHMDVVEHEKLQWIGDIPPASPASLDTPYSARFDFQGRKVAL
jgi:hypothetical protein